MRKNRVIAVLIAVIVLMSIFCSCVIDPGTVSSQNTSDESTTPGNTGASSEAGADKPEEGDPIEDDELNGEYGLSHIVVKNISNGSIRTYRVGDSYYGMLLSFQTIGVNLYNGAGVMSYAFERTVTTNITYEKIDNRFIMICEDPVDVLNTGNPQTRYELAIEELDGKVCFVLTATGVYDIFSYYVIAK